MCVWGGGPLFLSRLDAYLILGIIPVWRPAEALLGNKPHSDIYTHKHTHTLFFTAPLMRYSLRHTHTSDTALGSQTHTCNTLTGCTSQLSCQSRKPRMAIVLHDSSNSFIDGKSNGYVQASRTIRLLLSNSDMRLRHVFTVSLSRTHAATHTHTHTHTKHNPVSLEGN